VALAASGPVNIVVGAPREVAGELKITGTDLRPFFNRLFVNLGPFCTWDRGGWNGAKTVYTVTGTVGLGIEGDPLFVVTLAMPRDGTFTMHVGITESGFNWDYWDFWGVVQ
jgi:hypothetical protein